MRKRWPGQTWPAPTPRLSTLPRSNTSTMCTRRSIASCTTRTARRMMGPSYTQLAVADTASHHITHTCLQPSKRRCNTALTFYPHVVAVMGWAPRGVPGVICRLNVAVSGDEVTLR